MSVCQSPRSTLRGLVSQGMDERLSVAGVVFRPGGAGMSRGCTTADRMISAPSVWSLKIKRLVNRTRGCESFEAPIQVKLTVNIATNDGFESSRLSYTGKISNPSFEAMFVSPQVSTRIGTFSYGCKVLQNIGYRI